MPWVYKRIGDTQHTPIPEDVLKEMKEEYEDRTSWHDVVWKRKDKYGWSKVYFVNEYGYEDGVVGEC